MKKILMAATALFVLCSAAHARMGQDCPTGSTAAQCEAGKTQVAPQPVVVPHKHHEVVMGIIIENGAYYVNLSINGSPQFRCTIDSGASMTFFSPTVMDALWQRGFMTKAELVGGQNALGANGEHFGTVGLNINKVEIFGSGNSVFLQHVHGMAQMPKMDAKGKQVKDQGRDICLLGYSFFKAFKSWKIDNDNSSLTVEWYE